MGGSQAILVNLGVGVGSGGKACPGFQQGRANLGAAMGHATGWVEVEKLRSTKGTVLPLPAAHPFHTLINTLPYSLVNNNNNHE